MAGSNYLRAAFHNAYNLIVLGGMGLFGLLNPDLLPLILPITGALEGIYLLTVPGLKWFQRKVVLEEALQQREAQERARARLVEGLSPQDREMYQELKQLKQGIADHGARQGDTAHFVLEALGRLDQLIEAYLRMGLVRLECKRYLDETDLRAIEDDLRQLKRELPQTPPKARASKQQNIGILEKRLDRLMQIREYVEVMASQQKAIADAFRLLNDQVLTLGFTAEEEAGLISSEIDQLITHVGETEEAIKKISVDMTSVRKILGELSSTASF
ncbi:MAG: hypothetical protein HYY20_14255 [Candidatus Tectomicrobia bacterium]|uniref:Uncharacterized protein n=1 Tax=Tectimicrobiota bacterium TaxID=2528274 RepID=A0A932G295_UNCTE|nr:hypothetical protein [Candidatus Tectomicrobia bacterium]